MTVYDYIHDGNAIYERSFAIIRAEADLSRFSEEEADVAVRMIHACGMVEAAQTQSRRLARVMFLSSPRLASLRNRALPLASMEQMVAPLINALREPI